MRVGSIGEYIKEQREQAKISLRQLAAAAGVSNPYLSQIERGLRRPSAEILQQIAKGLRISAEALYVQAGILEDRPSDFGVRAAVLAEPELTERQKQVLLEIYESFRKEAAALREQAAAEAESGPEKVPTALDDPAGGVAWATVAGEFAAGAAGPARDAGPAEAGPAEAGGAEAGGAATAPPGPEEEIDDPLAAPALLNTEEAPGGQPPAPGISGPPSAGQEG